MGELMITRRSISSSEGGVALLWENDNPTAVFTDTTIDVDLSEYGLCIIEYLYSNEYSIVLSQIATIETGNSVRLMTIAGSAANGVHQSRDLKFTTSGFSVGEASRAGETNNGACVPYRIYGI